jgi:formylglycine-generating enzyme required for sulfatase activity
MMRMSPAGMRRFQIGRPNESKAGIGQSTTALTAMKQQLRWEGFKPNAFGLFDMLGNVWEWTCSEYKESYDGSEQKCAVSADYYSLRGGSWFNSPRTVRSANRYYAEPDYRLYFLGFRLAQD